MCSWSTYISYDDHMLCLRKQHAEICFVALNIIILSWKTKNVLEHQKKCEDAEFRAKMIRVRVSLYGERYLYQPINLIDQDIVRKNGQNIYEKIWQSLVTKSLKEAFRSTWQRIVTPTAVFRQNVAFLDYYMVDVTSKSKQSSIIFEYIVIKKCVCDLTLPRYSIC